jgi:hypothetical protein
MKKTDMAYAFLISYHKTLTYVLYIKNTKENHFH